MHSHLSNKIDLLVQKPLKIGKEWFDQHPSKEIVIFLSYYLCKFSEWDLPFGASMRRERDSLYKGKLFVKKRESEVKKFLQTYTLPLFPQTMEDFDKDLLEKAMMEKNEVTLEN